MDIIKKEYGSKKEMYVIMAQHIRDIFEETTDMYAALSNTSAMLALYLEDVNWVGFYLMKEADDFEKQDDFRKQDGFEKQLINAANKSINATKRSMLILGPFQGKPAVAHIEIGSGVCGTAVEQRVQQRVDDVRSCCNHIACDLATASEIVTPIFTDGEVWGVIDIDSPIAARFDVEDEAGMMLLAETMGCCLHII